MKENTKPNTLTKGSCMDFFSNFVNTSPVHIHQPEEDTKELETKGENLVEDRIEDEDIFEQERDMKEEQVDYSETILKENKEKDSGDILLKYISVKDDYKFMKAQEFRRYFLIIN